MRFYRALFLRLRFLHTVLPLAIFVSTTCSSPFLISSAWVPSPFSADHPAVGAFSILRCISPPSLFFRGDDSPDTAMKQISDLRSFCILSTLSFLIGTIFCFTVTSQTRQMMPSTLAAVRAHCWPCTVSEGGYRHPYQTRCLLFFCTYISFSFAGRLRHGTFTRRLTSFRLGRYTVRHHFTPAHVYRITTH